MRNSLETRLGMFAAVVILAAVIILETVGSFENLKRGNRVHAHFPNTQELKVGDRVNLAGVEVGRVERIGLTNGRVRVTMKLRPNAQVRADSVAVIRFTGLMGQNFVALSFGSPEAPWADDGAELASGAHADLNTLMARLESAAEGIETVARNFSADNLLGPVNDLVRENRTNVTEALANLRTISAQIQEGRGTLGRLVMDDSLYLSAQHAVTNLNDAADEFRLAIADARAGKGTVGRLLTDESLYNEATASMTQLREILAKVNRGDGTVGKLINDDEFYRNARLTLQKLDKATEGLEDQGPVSVMGSFISTFY